MGLLLFFIVAVAAFNVLAGLSMVVLDKRSEVAILLTQGMRERDVSRIFVLQGVIIAGVGVVGGTLLGLLVATHVSEALAIVESIAGAHLLDGTYFHEIPSRVLASDLLVVACASAALCLLAARIPARRAARIDPAVALHEDG